MSDDLERQLESWVDQASPVTADEARIRAEAGGFGTLDPGGVGAAGNPGPRRLLGVAAAVVLVGAVAIGGWVIANDGDERPTGVDTVDQPTTTTVNDSSTTLDPTTNTDGSGAEAPNLIVVHSADQRLEVLDRTTGDIVRVLAEFADPEGDVRDRDPQSMGSRYLSMFVVSADGQTVYYETCCERDAGAEVFRIPITGGDPELVTTGTNPAVSQDGTKLAVITSGPMLGPYDIEIERPALKVADLTDGTERLFEIADHVTLLASPSWSPDGSMLVLERYDESLEDGRVIQVEFGVFNDPDGPNDALNAASTIARTNVDGIPMHPVFNADGNVMAIRQVAESDLTQGSQAETYRISGHVDPIGTVDLDGTVLLQRTAGGGRFLLRLFADGTLTADLGNGESFGIISSEYINAAW